MPTYITPFLLALRSFSRFHSLRVWAAASLLVFALFLPSNLPAAPLIIGANGGGAGPFENTLVGAALALERGLENIEIKVGLTKDNQVIGFSDLSLNRLTDVASRFPERHRSDGSYYLADFSLAELRQLRLQPPFETGPDAPMLPIVSLEELLNLIRYLDQPRSRQTGLFINLIHPEFYRNIGMDLAAAVLDLLQNYPERLSAGSVMLATTDMEELQRIRTSLLPERHLNLPLFQMLAPPVEETSSVAASSWLLTNSGLRLAASYSDGIVLPAAILSQAQGLPQGYLEDIREYSLQLILLATGEVIPERLEEQLDKLAAAGVITEAYLKLLDIPEKRASTDQVLKPVQLPPFFSKLNLSPIRKPETPASVKSPDPPQSPKIELQ